MRAQAEKVENETEIELNKTKKQMELEHNERMSQLEINKAKRLAEIQVTKFEKQIESIGKSTIISMAKAGPQFQAKLLQGLGLKGFMMMDGKHPINLYNTAQNLIAQPNTV